MPDFVGPVAPPSSPDGNPPVLPGSDQGPNVPTVNPVYYPDPQLPGWINSNQNNNPSGRDINSLGDRMTDRILSVSPLGTYIPVVYGNEQIGPILSLIHIDGQYLYVRFVWCVGEIEEIESVTFQDGTTIPSGLVTWNHYTGTDSQTADPMLSGVIAGYSDTLTDLGADGLNVAYSVGRFRHQYLDGFPRVIAKIKGLKINSPVPVVESLTAGATGGVGDTAEFESGYVVATDGSNNGNVRPHLRYYEDDLIDGDSYRFKIIVTDYSDRGTGTTAVTWAGETVLDDDSNPLVIDGTGTYYGSASRATYDGTYNNLLLDIDGNNGVSMTYKVVPWNEDGNTIEKYSDNAGLFLNHLITDSALGLGLESNLETLADLVARNDEVLEVANYSEFRSKIGIALRQKKELSQTLEVLRGYARTRIYNEGGVVRYVPHQPLEPSFTITESDILPKSFKPSIRDFRNIPNVVRVYYTDTYTGTAQWRDNFVEVLTTEAENGTEPRREARYNLPALRSRPAALRYANEMINERLRTFDVKFRTHQKAYDKIDGETFTLDVDELGSAYKMRLVSKKKVNQTQYEIVAEKEDDAIYSNEIADYNPGDPILTSPDPFDVPDTDGVTIGENLREFQTGIYHSSIEGGWHPGYDYVYNHSFKVELVQTGTPDTVIATQILPQGTSDYYFHNVQQNVEYRVDVTVIGFAGTESDVDSSQNLTPVGKIVAPTNVPSLTVTNNDGIVNVEWDEAADSKEVWFYEIQHGSSGFQWDDGNSVVLARVDSNSYTTSQIAADTYDFKIKAVDNGGNYSSGTKDVDDVVVTSRDEVAGNKTFKGKLINLATAPANETTTATLGEVAYDSDYLFRATATNFWKVVPLRPFDYPYPKQRIHSMGSSITGISSSDVHLYYNTTLFENCGTEMSSTTTGMTINFTGDVEFNISGSLQFTGTSGQSGVYEVRVENNGTFVTGMRRLIRLSDTITQGNFSFTGATPMTSGNKISVIAKRLVGTGTAGLVGSAFSGSYKEVL